MANVATPIAEYSAALSTWETINDACAGEEAVKAAKHKYLPKLNPTDCSLINEARNTDYILRAVYLNASGRTLQGLVGLAFSKDPTVELPAGMEDVAKNLDGAGQTIVQHMHESLSHVVKNGRAGLLVDFPVTDGNTSRAAELTQGIRPTVSFYPATAIINWRTTIVGSQAKLSLVVLSERHLEFDGFGEKSVPQYRVLRLDGTYTVEIWRRKEKSAANEIEYEMVGPAVTPKGGNGQALTEIPFTFIGSQNNGVAVNAPPMRDIATVNIAHYRNSADYEDSVFLCGQPQVWISGLDETWRDHLEKQGIYVGSRTPFLLPTNSAAGMLQAEPNTLAKEAMDAKEKQMAALGARLIQADKSIKTATQQQSEDLVANSVLSLCCDNTSAAYTIAMTWVAMFANVTGKVSVSIPTEFTKTTIDAQELTALIGGVQSGLIPKADFWARMRLVGYIDPKKKDDGIREEIDSDPPLGLGAASDGNDKGADA